MKIVYSSKRVSFSQPAYLHTQGLHLQTTEIIFKLRLKLNSASLLKSQYFVRQL